MSAGKLLEAQPGPVGREGAGGGRKGLEKGAWKKMGLEKGLGKKLVWKRGLEIRGLGKRVCKKGVQKGKEEEKGDLSHNRN